MSKKNKELSHEKAFIGPDKVRVVIPCPFCGKAASHLVKDLKERVQSCECGAVHNHLGKSQKVVDDK